MSPLTSTLWESFGTSTFHHTLAYEPRFLGVWDLQSRLHPPVEQFRFRQWGFRGGLFDGWGQYLQVKLQDSTDIETSPGVKTCVRTEGVPRLPDPTQSSQTFPPFPCLPPGPFLSHEGPSP